MSLKRNMIMIYWWRTSHEIISYCFDDTHHMIYHFDKDRIPKLKRLFKFCNYCKHFLLFTLLNNIIKAMQLIYTKLHLQRTGKRSYNLQLYECQLLQALVLMFPVWQQPVSKNAFTWWPTYRSEGVLVTSVGLISRWKYNVACGYDANHCFLDY